MEIENIAGVVTDTFYRETEDALGYVPKDIPRLGVSFDKAVAYSNGLIGWVAIADDTPEANLLKPGDRVRCTIAPGKPGSSSTLLSLQRL